MSLDLPRIAAAALDRALDYGDARALAAFLGVHEAAVSRWRSGGEHMPADVLPRVVSWLGPRRGALFFGAIAEACGFSAEPLADEGSEASSFGRQRLRLHAAIGVFDGAVLECLEDDDEIDRVEAGGLVGELEVAIADAQRLKAHLVAVRDEKRGPVRLQEGA